LLFIARFGIFLIADAEKFILFDITKFWPRSLGTKMSKMSTKSSTYRRLLELKNYLKTITRKKQNLKNILFK